MLNLVVWKELSEAAERSSRWLWLRWSLGMGIDTILSITIPFWILLIDPILLSILLSILNGQEEKE